MVSASSWPVTGSFSASWYFSSADRVRGLKVPSIGPG
jgi:hypothetical protein